MNISEEPYRSRYPYLHDTYAEGYNEGTPRWNNLEVQDDLSDFVDPDTLNFALRDNAPVLGWVAEDVHDRVYGADGGSIAFVPIAFEKIGLAQGEYRLELGPLPFRKLGPKAGSDNVNARETQFWWTPSHNADHYRVRIAADAAMQEVVAGSANIGGPHRARPHAIGFGIGDELGLEQIKLQVAFQLLADVGRQTNVHGLIHDIRIGHRRPARTNAVEEIAHVIQRSLCSGPVVRQDLRVFAKQHGR